MPVEYRAGAEVNWPVVAGVGVLGIVACYILYSVNNLIQQAENDIGSALSALNPANWFNSNN
jgi:hypothetical protein